jgi:hypothetical protein
MNIAIKGIARQQSRPFVGVTYQNARHVSRYRRLVLDGTSLGRECPIVLSWLYFYAMKKAIGKTEGWALENLF